MNHSNQNTLRIIFLEDKQQDCELVAASLAAANLACEIIQARTKEEFEAALTRPDWDLILCDYTLPLYNGTEALAAAARLQPEIPFIFVSGTIGEERAVESLRMGATDYVLKDHLERLVPVVRRALREVGLQRAERRAQEQLKATERRLDHLLAQSPAVTYSLRPEEGRRVFTWISSNLEQLLGFTAAEACAPEWWSNQVHPQDAPALAGALPQLPAQGHVSRDFRIQHKNGEYRWVREEQRLVSDGVGRPVEILGSWVDTTERKGLEELLRQAQKMEAIGQLAGGVAHDFNNLLAVMGGNIELLLMDADQHSQETKTVLKLVLGAVQRAASLTRQLLAFSRKHVMQAQRFNLNDTIVNLAKMLKRVIGDNIQLQCDHAPGPMFLHGDVAMIEQVLMNLAINARDAMPQGGKLGIMTNGSPSVRALRADIPTPASASSSSSPSAIPARALRRSICRTSSSRSSLRKKSARAPAWAWRSFMASSSSTRVGSKSPASPAPAPALTSSCRPRRLPSRPPGHRKPRPACRGAASASSWSRMIMPSAR